MVEEVAAKKESAEVAGKNDCAEVAGKNDSAEVATKDERAEVADDEENAVTGAVKIQSTPVKGMELGNASTKVIKVKIDDDLILGENSVSCGKDHTDGEGRIMESFEQVHEVWKEDIQRFCQWWVR